MLILKLASEMVFGIINDGMESVSEDIKGRGNERETQGQYTLPRSAQGLTTSTRNLQMNRITV